MGFNDCIFYYQTKTPINIEPSETLLIELNRTYLIYQLLKLYN